MTDSELNENLPTWDDICEQRNDWSALLLGNGFSRNVWEGFSYESLYDTACSVKSLTAEDTRLFERLKTRNFESVLSALSIGMNVTDALCGDPTFLQKLQERYERIRDALIAAVHHVHVPWRELQPNSLAKVAEYLAEFKTVYSSNYDLLSYWAVMDQPGKFNFKDYFWSGKFDISNTEIWKENCITVHYLHGGLHLLESLMVKP